MHHRGAREGLREEDHVGVVFREVGEQPLPKRERLGVGVVHAERRHAGVHPVLKHVANRLVNALWVVVEVERIDVLILLWRVLRVRDGAVEARGEPLGVLCDPRVVGRTLQGQIERYLEPQFVGASREVAELAQRAEVGVDPVVAAVRRADRVRAARVAGLRHERVVAALAMRGSNGMDGRQIHDVEAHRGDRGQAFGRRSKGARRPLARALVESRPLGARKDLVPGRRQGTFSLHVQRVVGRDAHVVAQRRRGKNAAHGVGQCWGEARLRVLVTVAQRGDRVAKHLLLWLWSAHLVDRAA